MTGAEKGFLLLTCPFGDPNRPVLTTAQFRTLAQRAAQQNGIPEQRELTASDIMALGYGSVFANRVVSLLAEEDVLALYLSRGERAECSAVTRIDERYPLILRKRLGLDSPGSLWAKGDLGLLAEPAIALVGSRDIRPDNAAFAVRVGQEAAKQGYVLISGNARGADRLAQDACLDAGGRVISVLADELEKYPTREHVLYISEDGFDLPFTAQRAISRNRVIHALACKTFVAQVSDGSGGTWDGSVKNLRFGWSQIYCFCDESAGSDKLIQMGATPILRHDLAHISDLTPDTCNLF